MKKLLSLMLAVVLLMTIAPAAFGSSLEPEDYGKTLAAKLVAGDDAIALWNDLSENDKEAVRDFADKGVPSVEKFAQTNLSQSTLQKNISVLSEDQRLAVLINLIQVGYNETTSSPISTLATGYSATKTYTATNVFGGTLYTLTHKIAWNSDGSFVVSPAPSRTITPSTHTIGWSYEGATADDQRGGVGYNFYESNVVGNFKLTVVYDVQNVYPRIFLKGWANGTFDFSVSG